MDLMAMIDPLMTSPTLFPVVFVFSALDAFLPIVPSEGAVIAAGVFAASLGTPNLALVMAVAAAGAFLGDHVSYAIGRSVLGPKVFRRFPRLGRAVGAISRQLDRRGTSLILSSRFIPGGRTAVTLACGTAGYPLRRFSRAAAVAAGLWAIYCGLVGFIGGAAFAANPLLGLAVGLGLSFGITAVVEAVRYVRRSHRSRSAPAVPIRKSPQRTTPVCRTDLRTPAGHG
jgi:membrane-associated protein